jgi:hypothetical protein
MTTILQTDENRQAQAKRCGRTISNCPAEDDADERPLTRLSDCRLASHTVLKPDFAERCAIGSQLRSATGRTTRSKSEGRIGMVQDKRKPWTADEDEHLRQLVLSGASVASAAKRLGRTVPSVTARAYAIGVPLRRFQARRRPLSKWG